jgi:hypothetical protein
LKRLFEGKKIGSSFSCNGASCTSSGGSIVLSSLDRIKRLLLEEWDPIGIYEDPPISVTEYDTYAVVVFDQIEKGATVDDIADYLTQWSKGK